LLLQLVLEALIYSDIPLINTQWYQVILMLLLFYYMTKAQVLLQNPSSSAVLKLYSEDYVAYFITYVETYVSNIDKVLFVDAWTISSN
jgi:hypothetical protein